MNKLKMTFGSIFLFIFATNSNAVNWTDESKIDKFTQQFTPSAIANFVDTDLPNILLQGRITCEDESNKIILKLTAFTKKDNEALRYKTRLNIFALETIQFQMRIGDKIQTVSTSPHEYFNQIKISEFPYSPANKIIYKIPTESGDPVIEFDLNNSVVKKIISNCNDIQQKKQAAIDLKRQEELARQLARIERENIDRTVREAAAEAERLKRETELSNYGPKVRACVQPGVSFPTPPQKIGLNPTVKYRVSLKDDGAIANVIRVQTSENMNFDRAVETGIRRCNPFPKPLTGPYPSSVELSYSMYDGPPTQTPSTLNTPNQSSSSTSSSNESSRNRPFVNTPNNNVPNSSGTQSTKQTLTYSHGIYVGEVKNGKADGIGAYTSKQSGTVYSGQFVADTFSGIGTMTWTNGSKYVGEWSNDSGIKGVMTYSDGRTAIGTVKNAVFKVNASPSSAIDPEIELEQEAKRRRERERLERVVLQPQTVGTSSNADVFKSLCEFATT
jgi:hypothetical protein